MQVYTCTGSKKYAPDQSNHHDAVAGHHHAMAPTPTHNAGYFSRTGAWVERGWVSASARVCRRDTALTHGTRDAAGHDSRHAARMSFCATTDGCSVSCSAANRHAIAVHQDKPPLKVASNRHNSYVLGRGWGCISFQRGLKKNDFWQYSSLQQ